MKTTDNLSKELICDAFPYFGGSCNAQTAIGYAFTGNREKSEVGYGEFIFQSDDTPTFDRFDGFYHFDTGILEDLGSGETLSVKAGDMDDYELHLNRNTKWLRERSC